ncbi:SDR family NAD(P)-dependent oxidoreductase [Flavisphingomonas formosensis]|uniref:SDR family NAD(P)-dependent oxidoreductase n=1 Tax=Flavisphingomonas formosensis TaxID=861534 RepID=UPI0012F83B05|nr:SDR family oxidoreductase [Sphingomonas formosensis]
MLADGLRYFITGAGTGIGSGIARVAAREGAAVTIADLADEAGEALAEEIREQGGKALFVHCDVADYDQLKHCIDRSATEFGGLDVLVNNAGIFDNRVHPTPSLETMDPSHFRRMVEVNLIAQWMGAKFALPYLRASKNASIINAGSVAIFVAYPGGTIYGATKGGVAGLTKHLAVELAPDRIRVNCYCPGVTRTEAAALYIEQIGEEAFMRTNTAANLIPRIGEPEDLGNIVAFLASDRATFITGAIYLCDGGAMAWRGTMDLLGMQPASL